MRDDVTLLVDKVATVFGGRLPRLSAGRIAMVIMEQTPLREIRSADDAEAFYQLLTKAIKERMAQG